MVNWQKFRQLCPAKRWLLAQAVVLLALTAVALRVIGLWRWQRLLAGLGPAGVATGSDEQEARAIARLVDAAARRTPWRATCLHRSMALWWLLRRQGISGDLRIGVRKEAGRFEAHAWVEQAGLALNDGHDVRERFAAFDRAVLPLGGTYR